MMSWVKTARRKLLMNHADMPDNQQTARWYPKLFRTALRMTGSAENAADLTQQAFTKALAHWGEFDGEDLRASWLHRILINCVKDWMRSQAVRFTQEVQEWDILPAQRDDLPVPEVVQRKEQLALLRKAIDALPSKLRPAFTAAVLDGYSYEEVADLLKIPRGTVASRVSEARRQVSEAVRKAYPEVDDGR